MLHKVEKRPREILSGLGGEGGVLTHIKRPERGRASEEKETHWVGEKGGQGGSHQVFTRKVPSIWVVERKGSLDHKEKTACISTEKRVERAIGRKEVKKKRTVLHKTRNSFEKRVRGTLTLRRDLPKRRGS